MIEPDPLEEVRAGISDERDWRLQLSTRSRQNISTSPKGARVQKRRERARSGMQRARLRRCRGSAEGGDGMYVTILPQRLEPQVPSNAPQKRVK